MVPGLTLERWRSFAVATMDGPDEPIPPAILLVENERGYIQGICAYRLQRDVRHGPVLVVDELAIIDLIDGAAVAGALLTTLETLACDAGCRMIQLHIPEPAQRHAARATLYDALRQAGHVVDAVRMIKLIGSPAP